MLQVNFIMIYIIHKISVLLKITRILKTFFKEFSRFLFKKNIYFFSQRMMMESPINIIKNVRNPFRSEKLKK